MSQIRERNIFGGLPVQQKFNKLQCGIAVVDTRNGQSIGMFEFTSGVQEIYDVQFLAGTRRPMILNLDKEATRQAGPARALGLFWQNRRACALVFGEAVCSVVSRSGTHTEVHHGHDSHDVGGSGWLL